MTSRSARHRQIISLNPEHYAALVTWALVTVSSLYFLGDTAGNAFPALSKVQHVAIASALFISFMVGFLLATRDAGYRHDPHPRIALIIGQYLCIITLYWLAPFNYIAILATMWSAQLPYYLNLRNAIIISALATVPHWLFFAYHWQQSFAWLTSVLFWTFNIFAMVTMAMKQKEAAARLQQEQTNRELRATQTLLAEASRQSERTRIARNIHDLLGHHLTALSINLQVLARQSTGNQQQRVEQCRAITSLLLADVREAVSEMREQDALDLPTALRSLLVDVPDKTMDLKLTPELKISRVDVADAILRSVQEAITNYLRHSTGNRLTITLDQPKDNTAVRLHIHDNGLNSTRKALPGNGLTGMQERWAQLGGSFQHNAEQGFELLMQLDDNS